MRRPKITGKVAKLVKPLSRGKDRTPIGFWKLLAGKIAISHDAEDPKVRGDRLEPVSMQLLADTLKLNIDLEPGMWLSDDDEDIAITPDGAEAADIPTWAVETKAVDSALHLKFVIRDRRAKLKDGYKPLDSVPNEGSTMFREQAIQYFVVNEKLETLYFVFYDDRIEMEDLIFHYLTIRRGDIAEEIQAQKYQQINTLNEVNLLINNLAEGNYAD